MEQEKNENKNLMDKMEHDVPDPNTPSMMDQSSQPSLLDVGVLNFFTPILVLIFVFVIFYAIFEKSKMFGEEKGLHALIAIIFALLFIIVRPLRELITTLAPWFVILFFLIIIILMAVMTVGFKEADVTKYLSSNPSLTTTMVVIIIIIFLLGLKTVFPDSVGFPGSNGGDFSDLRRTLFNPKILGVFLIFIISYFVIRGVGFAKK